MRKDSFVIGIDFGTDSVRSLVVNAENGEEVATAVHNYTRWKEGMYCDSANNQFRQHPLDHIEGLERAIRQSIEQAPVQVAEHIRGISVDTTGSTPGPVDKNGTPIAMLAGFEDNPNAMFILWKDHTSVAEAGEINEVARNWGGTDFTMYEGGVYSSEWFWAKMLHVLRNDKKVRESAFSWVEHCDWIPGLLTGNTDPLTMKRSRCAAGHKAMWHTSFGGLPSEAFLIRLDPLLKGMRKRLYTETYTSDVPAGSLSAEWAERLGLPVGIPVGVGAFDAHMGAVGGAIRPYILSKVIGTSTCDMLVAPMDDIGKKLVRGICGQVDGSIIPGMLGMEAGQSAFGDIYAWFRDIITWPIEEILINDRLIDGDTMEKVFDQIIPVLSSKAENMPVDKSGIVALDWMNGRRTPDANQRLKGAIAGLNLGSSAPGIFKALVEATAFGSKMIVDRFESQGIHIKEVIALGGVAKKSPFVIQVLSNVLNRTIRVVQSEQTCALGAAMFAATVCGIYDKVEDAIEKMESGFVYTYQPEPKRVIPYAALYEKYKRLGVFIENETMS